jgi:hypothetical protein
MDAALRRHDECQSVNMNVPVENRCLAPISKPLKLLAGWIENRRKLVPASSPDFPVE